MKQAYRAADPVDAQLVVDLLASEGIEAFVQGQFLSGGVGELPAGELLRVWVADEQLDRARALIKDARSQAAEEDALDPRLACSWTRLWSGLQAAGEGLALRDELLAAWSQPHRRYHTLEHLLECLVWFESARHLASRPAEVEAALWFHDAVYELRADDNELRSAEWAARALGLAGVPAEAVARVREQVMATCHGATPLDADGRLVVDIDLAILGAAPERFDEYEVQVRQEYAWVPGLLFRRKRRQILEAFLARPRIYSTDWFQDRLEEGARANLQRSIRRLSRWFG